ncbi:MAG: hypothetical protein L0922_07910, partial [Candidatus Mariimomonas ferrooxydans]
MKRNLLIAAATLFILLTLSVIYLFYTERGLRQMASFITSSVPALSTLPQPSLTPHAPHYLNHHS